MERTKKEVVLSNEEEQELREGQEIYEMTRTPGFAVLKKQYDDLAYHSWVDPRETASKEEWEWRELNAFHAATVAKEMMDWINKAISRSEYLEKKKRGELVIERMRI